MESTYLAWRPATGDIPTNPGVYRFLDAEGRVIYVGKAKNLRSRVTNYFQDPQMLHPRTAQMVAAARSVQWTIVATEIEALTLEYQWINEFTPRFNVIFRDDKSYPYLAITMQEEFPRLSVSRDRKRKGVRYFGPYAKVWALRETIDLLVDAFPVRTCTAGVFRRAQAQGRPCLLGYIDRCSAPCVGKISREDYRELATDVCAFMEGDSQRFIRPLTEEMREAAAREDFETAARKRDQIQALEKVQERNQIAFDKPIDTDVFSVVHDELDMAVHAFYVRGGRVRGTQGWVVERVDERTPAELLGELLERVYLDRSGGPKRIKNAAVSVDDVDHLPVDTVPPSILVSMIPANKDFLQTWLTEESGRSVTVRVPQRGDKVRLMETVTENAKHGLQVYRTRRVGDVTQRGIALEELQEGLGLESAPLRIECFDISHTGGENRVGSMVVFEDGAPRKDAYRTFSIADEEKNDDTAAMSQVLRRRFARLGKESTDDIAPSSGAVDPDTGRPRRFSYQPDLLVVDGGLPQVNAAAATLAEIGANVPVVGLAKRLEEVWIPGESFPVIFPRSSSALYLLQHLRDESHRFAIRGHRKKRSRAQTVSALDGVPGLGPQRQKDLLKAFRSLKRIKNASVEELQSVPGIGPVMAATIIDKLGKEDPDAQQS